MKKQTISNRRQQLATTIVAVAVLLFAGSLNAAAQEKKSIGERYGSREPRACGDMKAPARGAITAALAVKYFICAAEKVDGQYLYLVENVKVEVGTSRPYNPNMDLNVPEIDVRFPLYPIRGSHDLYQCKDPKNDYIRIPGKTCVRYEHRNAKGFCYKTTFGDWRCYQTDLNIPNENIFMDVPPPTGEKGAGNKTAANDEPVDMKKTEQTAKTQDKPNAADRDENGFVKPDLSEMEKYFDNIRYEYDFTTRDLNIVGRMKKANNPNTWLVEYYDTDGARITWGNTILRGLDSSVGQVVKMYVRTPSEKQMRDEVKKIVITRKLD